jgi:hypothetical protein
MPRGGFEPPQRCHHSVLSAARLPVPPPRHNMLDTTMSWILYSTLNFNNCNNYV